MRAASGHRSTWRAAAGTLLAAAALLPLARPASAERLLLGVQTHFAYDRGLTTARVAEWIDSARLDSTRDEMFWSDVEDARGLRSLHGSAASTGRAWNRLLPGIRPLLTLGNGHPRFDAGGQPQSGPAVAGFAAYAGWIAATTQPRVRLFEVWNEWNLKAHTTPAGGAHGGAGDYVRLAQASVRAVKAVDPSLRVLVGGAGEDHPDWRWMRESLQAGLLDGADGVSVHLYNHCDRRNVGADEMLNRLDRLQDLLRARAGRVVPVYLTEVGWPVHRGRCGVTEAEAGDYLLRLLLGTSRRDWLEGVWVYEAIDGGDDETNQEHRFGLLRRDGSERPAGCMLRSYGRVVAARPLQWLQQGNVTAALYRDAQGSTVFVWSREGTGRASARLRFAKTDGGDEIDAAPRPGAAACGLPSGTLLRKPGSTELLATIDSARPAVFVSSRPLTLEGLQID